MSRVRIELNSQGIQALLKSPEMQAVLEQSAGALRNRVGGDYETEMHVADTRAWASVTTGSENDILQNSENNTLLKSLY